MTTETTSKPMLWTGRVLSAIFVLFMLMDVGFKYAGVPQVAQTMAALGWPTNLSLLLAVIATVCTVLYCIPATSVLGAVLMTGYVGGAIATHVRIGNPLFSHTLFGVYLMAFAWGGLWLRDPRLRAVFPLKRA